MQILLGFLPWIIYFIFSDPAHVLLGSGLALGALLLFGRDGLRKGRILDWVSLLFFSALTIAAYLGDLVWVSRYGFIAAGAVLTTTALGSVVVGTPFTLQYARESVPQEYQDSPLFLAVNRILSLVWAGTFALQTLLSVLYLEHIGSASLMNEVLPNVLTFGAIAFTARFPDWYTTRELSRGGVAALEGISPLKAVEFEGGRAAYRSIGSGKPLVMLNGSHMTLHNWDPELLSGLAEHHCLYLFDYPGIGRSSFPTPANTEALADWLAASVEALNLPNFSLLGYSMGGWLAQEYASRHPERVEGLVLIATDPGGKRAKPGSEEDLKALSDQSGTEMEQAYRMMDLMFPSQALEKVGPKLGNIFRAASLQPQLESEVVKWEDCLAERWYSEGEAEKRTSRLTMPVLLFSGGLDRIVPEENALTLKKLLPQAELIRFEGAGHGLIYQETEAILKAIREFLAPH